MGGSKRVWNNFRMVLALVSLRNRIFFLLNILIVVGIVLIVLMMIIIVVVIGMYPKSAIARLSR